MSKIDCRFLNPRKQFALKIAKKMFANAGPSGEIIATPFVCF